MMKTISKLLGVVAAIAALAACNKENADLKPVVPEGMHTISISVAQPSTKVTMLDNTGDLIWDEVEVIAAVLNDGAGNEFVAQLTQEGTVSPQGVATFIGDAPAGLNATNITDLYYPYVEGYEAIHYANYTVNENQDNLVPSESKYALKDILPLHWKGEGINDNVVTLSADRTAMVKIGKEYVSPVGGKVKVKFDNTVYTINTTSDKDLIFLVDVPSGEVVNPSFRVNWGSATPSYMSTNGVKKLEAGKRYQLVYGILPGEFTVDPQLKKVHFSQGNLQATYNGSSYTWGFAANQYDCIGTSAGNNTIGSQTNGAVVDLFGWSTDGKYGINASMTPADYSGVFKDWGENIGDGITWCTLSHEEWVYLFNTRTVNGGRGAGKSYSRNITYGGKKGLVLYPDNYAGDPLSGSVTTLPDDVVFLPAAGFRYGSEVAYEDRGRGGYWSSSAYNGGLAYNLDILCDKDEVDPGSYKPFYTGYNVRLITVVK